MQSKQHEFLSLAGVLPARLTVEQTAYRLNCAEHDIPILTAAGILRPLGKPAPNAPKFFALPDVEEIATNTKLLDKATAAIQAHWLRRRRGQNIQNGRAHARRNAAPPSAPHKNGSLPDAEKGGGVILNAKSKTAGGKRLNVADFSRLAGPLASISTACLGGRLMAQLFGQPKSFAYTRCITMR